MVNVTLVSPRFENSVTLRGNVAQPGRYPWHEGMRISDLIPNREFLITPEYWKQQNAVALQAQESKGRVSSATNEVRRNAPEINWDYAVVQRMSAQDLSTQLLPFNLGKAILNHDDASNLVLQPSDIVTVFSQADLRVPENKQTKLVRLDGEFEAAGIYRAQPGQRLRDLVMQAGGLTPSAYLYGAEFTRESARVEQQERLDMMIAQTEQQVARQTAQMAQNARTSDEVTAARAVLEAQRASLDKLRQLRADGRIVLNLHPNDQAVDAIPDITLEDGDQFFVPSRPIVVNVVGDVYNQGSFIQQPGQDGHDVLAERRRSHAGCGQGQDLRGPRQRSGGQQRCRFALLVGRVREHGADARRHASWFPSRPTKAACCAGSRTGRRSWPTLDWRRQPSMS